ncbi:MAG: hypothetical protein VCE91_14715 [Nitrospinota bacterium]
MVSILVIFISFLLVPVWPVPVRLDLVRPADGVRVFGEFNQPWGSALGLSRRK